jgi:hypothetical protein
MTPTEEAAVRAAIVASTTEAVDDGLRAAVRMVRIAKDLYPDWTFDQLADAIESTIGKH